MERVLLNPRQPARRRVQFPLIRSKGPKVSLSSEQIYEHVFCRFTQMTVLRLLTTAAVMGGDVRTMKRAWEIWDQIASDDRVGFLSEPDDVESRLRKYSRLATASPKVWADAYLLSFSQAAGLTLVTFDRTLGRLAAESVVIG